VQRQSEALVDPTVRAGDCDAGLTTAEVARQRALDGPNELPDAPSRSLLTIAVAAVGQPMFLLLLAAASLYGVVGQVADAASLLVSLVFVLGITVFQEYRTERVLKTLKAMASPRSRVVRDGQTQLVASVELVRGDRLLVAEGDRLACDATLLQANSLQVDESLLTGESTPVDKSSDTRAAAEHSDQARLHAGSLVVAGDGIARVSATGSATTLGQIGRSMAQIVPPESAIQRELKAVVRRVALAATLVCVAAALITGARLGNWAEGLLVGLTLAMAVIPEEFAVVWAVMMALGAWRMSQQQVLTRQAQAIESLGAASVLCVDKTGTLTHNRMQLVALANATTVQRLAPGEPPDAALQDVVAFAAMASVDDGLEPMDRAVHRLRATGTPPLGDAGRLAPCG
jgi:Ca2+-transporting ATPase